MSKTKLHPVSLRRPRNPQAIRRRITNAASSTETPIPFRWNIAHREQLGTLLEGEISASYNKFVDNLLACAAQAIGLAGDSDLVFLGRSPESLYDVLSALLMGTSWQKRLTLLPFSKGNEYSEAEVARRKRPEALAPLRAYLHSYGLSPAKLIVRERPVAVVDLVCNGTTMHQFLLLIRDWALEEKVDWPSVKRKLRVVAIVRQDDQKRPRWKMEREGRTTWRWHKDADWIGELLDRGALREAAISRSLWEYLGDNQIKTAPSFSPQCWGTDEAAKPCHKEHHLTALRSARQLFEIGLTKTSRAQFAAFLASHEIGMRSVYCRGLVTELRGVGSE